jgi:hypothetical protein
MNEVVMPIVDVRETVVEIREVRPHEEVQKHLVEFAAQLTPTSLSNLA